VVVEDGERVGHAVAVAPAASHSSTTAHSSSRK
jgi:hypothetical protein